MKNNSKIALISILIAAFLGGGISVFVKIAVTEIPPFVVTFLRFFIASLTLLPFLIRERKKIDKSFYKVILLSLFSSLNVILFSFGIRLTTATVGQLLYSTVPVFAAIFSYFILKERIGSKKASGILLGFAGVILIILLPVQDKGPFLSGSLLGNLMIFVGVLTHTIYSVLSKNFQVKYSPLLLTAGLAVTTTMVAFPFIAKDLFLNTAWMKSVSSLAIFSTFYIGLVGGTIYYFLYQNAIKYGSPVIASMILFLQPVSAFVWASILLGERLTLGIVAGAILVLLGVWTVTKNKNG